MKPGQWLIILILSSALVFGQVEDSPPEDAPKAVDVPADADPSVDLEKDPVVLEVPDGAEPAGSSDEVDPDADSSVISLEGKITKITYGC